MALLRNHSDNSFMFQIISHFRNDIKLRRGNIFDKAMELVQKRLSAICLDFQSMVELSLFKWSQSCCCYGISDRFIMNQGS